jgi:DNA mismatch repair protein MutL
MSIKKLSKSTAEMIAAGEVIARPASVVKELVENSIDAKAKKITIEIEKAGSKLIKIIDDGEGIAPQEIKLALERYATSKLNNIENLQTLTTFGFRGEALPSIASVSQMSILSRRDPNISGVIIKAEGIDNISEPKEIGAPPGTTVEVKNLFFNTPARRKFLKSDFTETNHINNIIIAAALSNLNIHFIFKENNKEVLNLPVTHSLEERIINIFGKELKGKLHVLNHKDIDIEITGLTANPAQTRSNREYQWIFVNKRHIDNRTINHAIIRAYEGKIAPKRFPIIFIFININPEKIDVNVHPAKKEVRFQNPSLVHDSVAAAIKKTLSKETPKTTLSFTSPDKNYSLPSMPKLTSKKPFQIKESLASKFDYNSEKRQTEPIIKKFETEISLLKNDEFKLIGSSGVYLIVETSEGIMFIDQHAAHERIIYEGLINKEEKSLSQIILIPQTVELNFRERDMFNKTLPILKDFGFEIEEFGKESFLIRAVPSEIKDSDLQKFIKDVLTELLEEAPKIKTPELKHEIAARLACHSAIRKGNIVEKSIQEKLIRQLLNTPNLFTCPHGRPCVVKFTRDEIDKWFKRK